MHPFTVATVNKLASMAERTGFEPAEAVNLARFPTSGLRKFNNYIAKNGFNEPFSFCLCVNISVKFAYNSVDLSCFIFCKNMFVAVFMV